ncbi:MAG: ATP-dependent DNA ligase [Acidobacteria bacterium]|nr:ATP-dependent DNA ligase [Acidobacteriota bacterium]MCA1642874.1 ATP-dependent DNA ligase [Acidobacteriota bacterium]
MLEAFARTADEVAATTKKLEKARLLGAYFHTLSDDDLVRAARYFAGHQFALNDARTTNVGGGMLRDAIGEVTGLEVENLRPRYVRLGDSGEVAFEAFDETGRGKVVKPTFTLAETESLIERLSGTRGTKNKREVLVEALRRAAPLEAKYLVKLLIGDLRIGLQEGLVEDSIARAFERPLAQVARVNMLAGDVGEAALCARRDELAGVSMRLFHPIKFMLATAAADLADVARTMPAEFFVEDKFDGIRGQAHVGQGRVALFTRTLDEVTHRFPELPAPLKHLSTDAILDGEILPARGAQILPFAELQKRLGRKTVSDELLAEVPVVFVAYDLLYADGRVMFDEPLAERRRVLESLIAKADEKAAEKNAGTLRLSAAKRVGDANELDAEFDAARSRGNEGLMIKDPRSSYKPGKRGREWLKLKRALATLDVVVTSVEVGHGKRRNLLSDYTFAVRRAAEDAELLNVGKAYSGLTDAELAELTDWFRAHTLQEFAHGRVRVVEPKIVLEVTFDRVQESKRHRSGYALRFPRILRRRDDKSVEEIDTLDAVRRLAEGNDEV